jgi:cobalt/nickel transport system ATP-binding protein
MDLVRGKTVDAEPTGRRGYRVETEGLVYRYADGRTALDGLSLRVEPGERLGIIGPSGAGKSTFLLHLNGVFLPAGGVVRIDGQTVERKNLMEIRRHVGIVFQNPDDQLFTPTVEEDIAFGPLNMGCNSDEVAERVRTALDQMRLKGYEKRSTHDLSYGEKRRVALATVLAMRPNVIGLDEPFAGLDPGMVEQLVGIIQQLDATVILISQEILPAIASCDRLAIFDQGRLVAAGPALDIASDRDLLRNCGIDFHFYGGIWNQLLKRQSGLKTGEL